MTLEETGKRRCRNCGKELPLEDFYQHESSPDGYRAVCKHCYIERQQRKKCGEDHVTKHRPKKVLTPEEREQQRLYYQAYREAHRDKCREASRKSNARRRNGEPRRIPGPEPGTVFSPLTPLGTRKPVHADRTCQHCMNYPCFQGIENLETDFAAEGCHGWHPRSEAV